MPPRWPRKPDRKNDPDYRRLEDRINFAVHVAACLAVNSGIWFFDILQQAHWPWATWLTGSWVAILVAHLIYIAAIADYSVKSES